MSKSDSLDNRRLFLRKKERLRSKIAFEYLFEHGSRFSAGVLRFFYAFDVPPSLVQAPLSVAVTAPKKTFRLAVKRNLLKRRMREAFRQNKHILLPLLTQADQNLIILIKYNNNRIASFDEITASMTYALNRMKKEVKNT